MEGREQGSRGKKCEDIRMGEMGQKWMGGIKLKRGRGRRAQRWRCKRQRRGEEGQGAVRRSLIAYRQACRDEEHFKVRVPTLKLHTNS